MASRRVVSRARYILSSVKDNNNKHWSIVRYDDGEVVTEWGRVGAKSTVSSLGIVPSSVFEKRCREKEAKGYAPLQVVYDSGIGGSPAPSASALASVASRDIIGAGMGAQAASTSTAALERLVRLLARQNIHDVHVATGGAIVDAGDGLFRTPLGVVTGAALAEARALLERMAPLVVGCDFAAAAWPAVLSQYLTLIPRDVGQRRPDPARLFPDAAALQREQALLDSLAASLHSVEAAAAAAAVTAAAPAEQQQHLQARRHFDVHLRLVEVGEEERPDAPSTAGALWPAGGAAPRTGEVFKNIRSLFAATAKSPAVHAAARLRLRRVYELQHAPMAAAFHAEGDPGAGVRVGNVLRLWHGTRVCNLLSILRHGLLVPPASSPHVTGRMYGDGIYGSDCSTKALNYSLGAAPGQRRSAPTSSVAEEEESGLSYFGLLNDTAMGRAYDPSASRDSLPAPGTDSTWARAGSSVMNDEMIVYRASQINPRWLCEFVMPGERGADRSR